MTLNWGGDGEKRNQADHTPRLAVSIWVEAAACWAVKAGPGQVGGPEPGPGSQTVWSVVLPGRPGEGQVPRAGPGPRGSVQVRAVGERPPDDPRHHLGWGERTVAGTERFVGELGAGTTEPLGEADGEQCEGTACGGSLCKRDERNGA